MANQDTAKVRALSREATGFVIVIIFIPTTSFRDVEELLRAWQETNQTKHWSEGMGDVQFQKNTRL